MLLGFDFSFLLTVIILIFTIGIMYYYKKFIGPYSDFPSINFIKLALKCTLMKKIPKHVPVTSFFFQHWIDICSRFQQDGLCLIWIRHPYLFIFNEEAFKIFANDSTSIDKPFDFSLFKEFWGTNLLTSSGDLWRKRRKMLNPLFYKSMLKDKAPVMNKNAALLVKQLKELPTGEPVVVIKYLKLCAFMNIYEYLSGLEFNKPENFLEAEDMIDAVTTSTEMATYRIVQPWLHPRFMMVAFEKGRKFLKRLKEGHQKTYELLGKMRNSASYIGNGKEKEDDEAYKTTRLTFAKLIKEINLKDPSFTSQDAKDEFTGLLTAGYDTVSYALMWSLFLLGHHSEIQDRLFEEIDSYMESQDTLSGDDLQNLKYLDCVIKETLRLFPPIPIFARYLSKDVKYRKYTVPRGTNIVFFLYTSGRDPHIFPEPEKFDPERFLGGNAENTLLTWSFAEGARNCIGKHFALMELKIVLAHIIKNFKVTSLNNPKDIHLSWEVVLTTVEPLKFLLSPRILQQE